MDTKALELIPPKVRQRVYLGLTLVALGFTAAAAVYGVSPYEIPWWIGGGLAGVGVLAAPFGVLAAVNVPPASGSTAPTRTAVPEGEPITYTVDGALDHGPGAEPPADTSGLTSVDEGYTGPRGR